METLFIDRKETKLSCNQQRLYIKKCAESKAVSIPLRHLKSVVISCDCQLSSGMLRQLAKNNISLICLNNRDPDASFISTRQTHGNVLRRINQYQLLNNEQLRIRFSAIIIKRKISGQRQQLKTLMRKRRDLQAPLSLTCRDLMESQKHLNNERLGLSEVMGVEGNATRLYYAAFKLAFNHSLDFNKRNKHPPKDPVNAVLSLSYTFLYYEAQRACMGQGLDPALPILHQPSYNRASLACDLQEALRAEVAHWVWQLFQQRILREDHFLRTEESCLLNKSGRKHYYNALPDELVKWRLKLREHCHILVKIIDSCQLDETGRGCYE